MTPTVRDVLAMVGRRHRGRWACVLVVAVIAGMVELVGAATIYVLLALVADPAGELALPMLGDVRDLFAGVDDRRLQLGLVTAVGVFVVVRAGTQLVQAGLQTRVSHRAGAELSHELVRGYVSMPRAFHLRRSSSELVRNAHSAVNALVELVVLPVIGLWADGILVVGLAALLATIAPWTTLLAVGVAGCAVLLQVRVVTPRRHRLGREAHDLDRQALGALQQVLEGQPDDRVLGRGQDVAEVYGARRHELARVRHQHATAAALPRTVIELALVGFVLVVLGVAIGARGTAAGAVPVLGLFAYAGLRLQPPLQRIAAALTTLRFADAPLESLHEDAHLIGEH